MKMVVSEKYVVELERIRQFMVGYMQSLGIDIDNDATFEVIMDKEDDLEAVPTITDFITSNVEKYVNNEIEQIDAYAFNHNETIKEVELNNLVSFDSNTFLGATALSKLHLDNITTKSGIGESSPCFSNSLKDVSMENVTSLGAGIFYNCSLIGTGEFNLPNLYNTTGNKTFYGCGFVRIDENNFPELISIRTEAFRQCTSLEYVHLPKLIENLSASSLFHNCTSLETAILENVIGFTGSTDTGNGRIFQGCSSLEVAYLPKLLRKSQYFFAQCSSLKKISLPSVTANNSSSSNMFLDCSSLEVVDLGNASSIDSNDFANDIKLETLILRKTSVVPLQNVNAFSNTPFAANGSGGTLLVPRELISQYSSATNWSTLNITISAIEDSGDYSDRNWYKNELIDEGIIDEI